MIENAIAKLQSEMSQNANKHYIQVVGAFLLEHLGTNPGSAEKIMAQDKTIGKSLDEMKKEAKKKQMGGCAVLTDQEGFEIVLKYFGIKPGKALAKDVMRHEPRLAFEKPNVVFDVKLEDLL